MKNKSAPFHFEIHTKSSKPSGYIRNSYRENGKVKHDTVGKINGCTIEQLRALKAAFDGKVFTEKDIFVSDCREYGASYLLHTLAKSIGVDKLIYARNEEWVKYALAMIIGRIVYQGSKLALSKCTDYSALFEVCGIHDEKIDVNSCYDAMDELLLRQTLIQKKLAKKHLQNGCVVLYDITSSYCEGLYAHNELLQYGYSRDKKRGKKQIVIGLICTKEGCPIAVEVFAGNTNDASTVAEKVSEIKETFGVDNFIFVGDRGMLTKANLGICNDIGTITALTHSDIKKLYSTDGFQMSLFDEDTANEYILPENPNVRYVLRKNPDRRRAEGAQRTALIEKTHTALAGIAIPKRKTSDYTLGKRAEKIFAKYGVGKYFHCAVVNGAIEYARKNEVIENDEKFDGLYVIRGESLPETFTAIEIVNTYKSLIHVEQAFRSLKTTQLEIRPYFHKTPDRIKAHVFICMLSYYLMWHLKKALAPLLEEPHTITIDHVIEVMKSMQTGNMTIGGIQSSFVARPTPIQKQILQFLDSKNM